MRLNKLIITFLIISLLLLAGCKEKECKTRTDCPSKGSCWIASCIKNTCDYRAMSGCTCGDGDCKDDENPCTCEEDCGECKGTVGDFMEKVCVNNECITQIKGQEKTSAEDVITYEESRIVKLQMNLKVFYDNPFNVKKSLMKVNLKIDKKTDDVSDVKISKIKVIEHTGSKDRYGRWVNDAPVTLTETSYTKILFDESSLFDKEFPVYIEDLDPKSSLEKTVTLEITYEFNTIDRYGKPVARSGVFEKEILMTLVSPDAPVSCPDCEDNNPCTDDDCGPHTNYFCEHNIISTGICCGDDTCSPGEDRCRCPGDCGACTGSIGDYMKMGCSALNLCTFQVRDPNLIQSTSKLADVNLNGASMSLKVIYDIPFDKSSSTFSFTFEPKVFTGVRNLVLKKITFLDKSGTILGEQNLNTLIPETSSATVSGMLTYETLNAEEKKTVSARFDYTCEKQGTTGEWSDLISSYSYSFGELTILNPE
ncbi:hypothetical protein KY345_06420 [Candidatus Woesearchaeota archaeon]|nr:hypothetical protein [Candidatus Woesearchaeota archaeon]